MKINWFILPNFEKQNLRFFGQDSPAFAHSPDEKSGAIWRNQV
ncbi:hypothetical protein [Pedobacter jejuensis]|nr:hypothetical protein [Pedobacter jejuensis]